MIDLKEKRTAAGMTQQELADALDCHRTTVTNIEIGNIRPSVDMAKGIGRVLGFDWTLFFDEKGESMKGAASDGEGGSEDS